MFPENTPLRPVPRFDSLSTPHLVAALDSLRGRQRDAVQRLLIHRRDKVATALLRQMARESANPFARLHALCTLDGLNEADSATLLHALADEPPTVRRHAVRISEKRLSSPDAAGNEVLSACQKLASDADPHVRLQLACSLGFSQDPRAIQTLAQLVIESKEDLFIREAVFSSLNKHTRLDFYAAISQDADAMKACRKLAFEMASRLEDGAIMSRMLSDLVGTFDAAQVDVQELDAITEALTAWKKTRHSIDAETKAQIDRISEAAIEIVHDDTAAMNKRVAAIRCLATAPSKTALESYRHLVHSMDAKQPLEVQLAVIDSLGHVDDGAFVGVLLRKFRELSPSVRNAILVQVFTRKSWTQTLISEMTRGVVETQDVSVIHRQVLLTHADPEIKVGAACLFGDSHVEANKAHLIEKYRTQMLGHADPDLGKPVFVKHCSACHHIGGVGHIVGPDLTALMNRSAPAMLTAILDPNQAVEDKYQSYNVWRTNGNRNHRR